MYAADVVAVAIAISMLLLMVDDVADGCSPANVSSALNGCSAVAAAAVAATWTY